MNVQKGSKLPKSPNTNDMIATNTRRRKHIRKRRINENVSKLLENSYLYGG